MIEAGYQTNFETLRQAFKDGNVCLAECTDKATGEPVITICSVHTDNDEFILTPFAKMFDGNPYDELTPPE